MENLGFVAAIIGAIIGFMGAVIGAKIVVASDNRIERDRRKQDEKKERMRAYSRLKGFEYSILQSCTLYSVAHIDHLYLSYVNIIQMPDTADEKISYIEDHPVFIQHLDEARYRQNDSALELGKSRETLEKYLTDIELLFVGSFKVKSLKSSINVSMRNFINYINQIKDSYDNAAKQETSIREKREKLSYFKEEHLKMYPKKVKNLENGIDNLLSYLKEELGENEVKSRWQFWR